MAGMTHVVVRTWVALIAVSLLAFAVVHAMPADPVELLLLEQNIPRTAAAIAALEAQWGLDRPLPEQYLHWLGRFITGDWGTSFYSGRPILHEFAVRLPVSLAIGLGGILGGLVLGTLLGYAAAARPGGAADRTSRVLSVAAQAVPAFWLGLLLIWLLGVELRLLRPFTGSTAERVALPILLVALYQAGTVARLFRQALLDAETQPFFTVALAKGISRPAALRTHAGRNALIVLLAASTPEFAWAIGGTAVLEVVFAVPGVSQYLVDSIAMRDFFVLQAYIVCMAVWMLLIHAGVAVLRRMLDPRTA